MSSVPLSTLLLSISDFLRQIGATETVITLCNEVGTRVPGVLSDGPGDTEMATTPSTQASPPLIDSAPLAAIPSLPLCLSPLCISAQLLVDEEAEGRREWHGKRKRADDGPSSQLPAPLHPLVTSLSLALSLTPPPDTHPLAMLPVSVTNAITTLRAMTVPLPATYATVHAVRAAVTPTLPLSASLSRLTMSLDLSPPLAPLPAPLSLTALVADALAWRRATGRTPDGRPATADVASSSSFPSSRPLSYLLSLPATPVSVATHAATSLIIAGHEDGSITVVGGGNDNAVSAPLFSTPPTAVASLSLSPGHPFVAALSEQGDLSVAVVDRGGDDDTVRVRVGPAWHLAEPQGSSGSSANHDGGSAASSTVRPSVSLSSCGQYALRSLPSGTLSLCSLKSRSVVGTLSVPRSVLHVLPLSQALAAPPTWLAVHDDASLSLVHSHPFSLTPLSASSTTTPTPTQSLTLSVAARPAQVPGTTDTFIVTTAGSQRLAALVVTLVPSPSFSLAPLDVTPPPASHLLSLSVSETRLVTLDASGTVASYEAQPPTGPNDPPAFRLQRSTDTLDLLPSSASPLSVTLSTYKEEQVAVVHGREGLLLLSSQLL